MTQTSPEISGMFTEISRRYDVANRILSFGLDKSWRQKLIQKANPQPRDRILDICTGTADLISNFAEAEQELFPVGVDFSRGMLEVGLRKTIALGIAKESALIEANALNLPFGFEAFDIISISFGLRNLTDRKRGLQEMARVIKPRGKLVILEFSLPKKSGLWRGLYLFYLKYLLPQLGGLLTGSRSAYRYLHDSIRQFPDPDEISHMMESAGFERPERKPLMGGIAMLYSGIKI